MRQHETPAGELGSTRYLVGRGGPGLWSCHSTLLFDLRREQDCLGNLAH
jgi:hypothetical protein